MRLRVAKEDTAPVLHIYYAAGANSTSISFYHKQLNEYKTGHKCAKKFALSKKGKELVAAEDETCSPIGKTT